MDSKDFIILLLLGIFFIASLLYWAGEKECSEKAKVLNYKCEYGFWTGCVMTKPNGKKVLLEQLRGIEVQNVD